MMSGPSAYDASAPPGRRGMPTEIDARRIVEHIAAIDEATGPPRPATWEGHVAWALRLRDEFLTPDAAWSADGKHFLYVIGDDIYVVDSDKLPAP